MIKVPSIKFYETCFSWSRVLTCRDGLTPTWKTKNTKLWLL